VINPAPIQNEEHVLALPGLDRRGNQRAIEIRDLDEFVSQPAAHLSNSPGCLGFTGNMLGDFAQVNGMRLNQSDDDPGPILNAAQVLVGMHLAQFRKQTGV
jgi:hypothetical protein